MTPECWILYDRGDLEQNRFFAERLRSSGEGLGLRCRIVTTDRMPSGIPDAVVSRCRDHALSSRLEDAGATVCNNPRVSETCNDKLSTYRLAGSLGIPHLPFALPGEDLPPGPPWVVKSRAGHGGAEVFLARTRDEAGRLARSIRQPLIQQTADVLGRDMRVYMLGTGVLASVMRSSDSDFRANFKLGGSAELCEPSEEISGIAMAIAGELDSDLIGVDFVFGEGGKAFLNEVEDAVGTRMLYELTDLDPARLLMKRVYSKISL